MQWGNKWRTALATYLPEIETEPFAPARPESLVACVIQLSIHGDPDSAANEYQRIQRLNIGEPYALWPILAGGATDGASPVDTGEDEVLATMIAARAPTAAISHALSRSEAGVSQRIVRLDLPRRAERSNYSAALDQALLGGTRLSVRALARQYDIPEQGVRRRAVKLGVRLSFAPRRRASPTAPPPAATRDDAADHVRVDILLALLRRLRAGPCRLADLLAASGRSRAMVFRYLAAIRAMGVRIPCRRGEYGVADWGVFDPARL